MNDQEMTEQFAKAKKTIHDLQEELNLANSEFVALTLEFEQRVDERTIEISEANKKLHEEITERIRAEEALAEYSEHLEELVGDRTRDLVAAQKQLIDQEKMAILGKVAGAMARELHNPLCSIKNAIYYLNMVLKDPEPDVGEMLEILEQEVVNTTKVISGLLEFTEPRKISRWIVGLGEIIQEALARSNVPDYIKVTVQQSSPNLGVKADPNQLATAFRNIINNAIQAMSPILSDNGGKQLIINTIQVNDEVSISFSDNGEGIPDENMERLYEPLFSTRAQGIGLGLPLAKALIEEHDGRLEVESQVGIGSSFTVWLPLAQIW